MDLDQDLEQDLEQDLDQDIDQDLDLDLGPTWSLTIKGILNKESQANLSFAKSIITL